MGKRMQMRKMMKRICASILLSLLLLPISVMAEGGDAEDLTDRCKVELDSVGRLVSALDGDTQTACTVYANRSMTVSWTDDVPAASVFLAFSGNLTPYSILQYDADGTLLSEEAGPCVWNHLVKPMEATRRLTVRAGAENVRINTLAVFGEGEVPNYHPWAPTPEKLDYLLVAMHPDDDILFLGGVIPIYGAEQGREGTALYMASRERRRVDEAMNGAWTMGLRNEPLFGGFRDIAGAMRSQYPHEFLDYQVAYYLVEQIRKYRPEVVVTQDLEGEYGHWQHRVMAKAVLEAVQHANDPTYHAASAKTYGTWEVKKLYFSFRDFCDSELLIIEIYNIVHGIQIRACFFGAFFDHFFDKMVVCRVLSKSTFKYVSWHVFRQQGEFRVRKYNGVFVISEDGVGFHAELNLIAKGKRIFCILPFLVHRGGCCTKRFFCGIFFSALQSAFCKLLLISGKIFFFFVGQVSVDSYQFSDSPFYNTPRIGMLIFEALVAESQAFPIMVNKALATV